LSDLPSAPPDSATAFLVLRIAGRPGPAFPLDPAGPNVLGRGPDSLVALADRLASRTHAEIRFDPAAGRWTMRDLGSRNGTWVEGTRVTEAGLADGDTLRVGTSELEFRTASATGPQTASGPAGGIVRRGSPAELEGAVLTRMAATAREARWPMLLYQSGLRLLAATSPWQVTCTTLELAAECTAATSFGWFEPAADGRLEPACVVPPTSGLEPLVDGAVAEEIAAGRAVWVSTPDGDVAGVPLLDGQHVRAALVTAAPAGSLRECDFDVLVTLASLAAAAGAGRERAEPPTTDACGGPPPGAGRDAAQAERTLALSGSDFDRLGLDSAPAGQAASPRLPSEPGTLRIEDWQRALVGEALRRSGGSVPEAATALGISRATLYRKLESYGLTRDRG